MFYKSKVKKYISRVQEDLKSEDFIDLFINTDVLGFSDSEMGEEEFEILERILNQIYSKIISEPYQDLLLDDSDYLIPYTLGWVKIHCYDRKPEGLTFYFKNNAYKLFLNRLTKQVSLNVLDITTPKMASIVAKNLSMVV